MDDRTGWSCGEGSQLAGMCVHPALLMHAYRRHCDEELQWAAAAWPGAPAANYSRLLLRSGSSWRALDASAGGDVSQAEQRNPQEGRCPPPVPTPSLTPPAPQTSGRLTSPPPPMRLAPHLRVRVPSSSSAWRQRSRAVRATSSASRASPSAPPACSSRDGGGGGARAPRSRAPLAGHCAACMPAGTQGQLRLACSTRVQHSDTCMVGADAALPPCAMQQVALPPPPSPFLQSNAVGQDWTCARVHTQFPLSAPAP